VQRKPINAWPVVLERSQAGEFALGAGWRKRLLAFDLDPLAYGAVLGEALFHGTVRDAFMKARDQTCGELRTPLAVEANVTDGDGRGS
jgi:hypothetical protein